MVEMSKLRKLASGKKKEVALGVDKDRDEPISSTSMSSCRQKRELIGIQFLSTSWLSLFVYSPFFIPTRPWLILSYIM